MVVPGGFSYGDYLRAGAIASLAPIMGEVVDAAGRGMPVLGICNGFQILCEAGLLPGALTRNAGLHFVCRDLGLRVESTATAWTSGFAQGQEIVVPLKSGEGRYVADAATLARAGGRGPGGVPLRRRRRPTGRCAASPGVRSAERARGRADAAPGARRRPAHRPVGGRPRPVHVGARGRRRP